jgi:hypothetical protein
VSATKRTKSAPIVPPWLRHAIAMVFGPGRTVTLAVLILAGFAGGAWAVWRHVEHHVENSPDYLVDVERVTITPQPEWIRSDVRAEAFRTASSSDHPLSSLDDGLTQRIYSAFMLHPWVVKATVTKRAGGRVNVDVIYRRPVCMVEIANGSVVELLPIDGEGVWLPGEDFSQKQKESYPCLAGIDRRPIQPAGHAWGDTRVVDGAAIASALLPVWPQLKLYRIQPSAQAQTPGDRGLAYELYTRAGTRIVWGSASGSSAAGEPLPDEKVGRLLQYAASHGSLDVGAALDVRKMPPVGASKR